MKKRKNHSAEFKGKVALEAIREEMTLALSAWKCGGCPTEPGLVRRYYLYPDAARVPVPCGDLGLVQPQGSGLEAVQQYGH